MTASTWLELAWLPRAPSDFKARLRSLGEHEEDLGRELRVLTGSFLNTNQLHSVARLMRGPRSEGRDLSPLVPFKLGLLSNATTDLLGPAIIATAPRHGLALELIEAPFNQAASEAFRPDSVLNRARPEAVLLLLDHRGLPLGQPAGDPAAAERVVEESLSFIQAVRGRIRAESGACCIVQTVPRPPEALLGSFDYRLAGTGRSMIDAFNRRLAESLVDTGDLLLDAAGLAETVGLAVWHDPRYWNLAKLSFAQELVPLYADHVCRILAAMKGKSRRCLILDLDNTLWGGAVGDLGLEGIELGQGSPAGEAYQGVQRTALHLRERGVVLAVCSKNDESVARLPFLKHPDMLLSEEHIAVFQASWADKASGVRAIAQALDLGLESMVLLDDNPAERLFVRRSLPEVAVPELPQDPALFTRTLLAAGYFEAITFTKEDRERADYYQGNARRIELQRKSPDLGSYLNSLNMVATISPFDGINQSRIAQLINKTNQFNLTTRRYTEAAVRDLGHDPAVFTLQVRLRDDFGDNGLVSAIVCRKQPQLWEIDTWLMSCRVLGRKVEAAVLQELVRHAGQAGARRLVGRYIPTKRNGLVRDHYAGLGFTQVDGEADGGTTWVLDLADVPAVELPMRIESVGFSPERERDLIADASATPQR
jgi:FkbH-like protein